MKFELSNHIALQHPDWKNSQSFYNDVLGLDTTLNENHLHVRSKDQNLYIMDNDELRCVFIEFNVKNVEEARHHLEKHGCSVVKWEGKGNDCYMRDPFGLVFNLWEKK